MKYMYLFFICMKKNKKKNSNNNLDGNQYLKLVWLG